MEEVEQKKKLISTMRNKPWRMMKKLSVLRYWEPILSCCQLHFASSRHGIFADVTITLQTWKSDQLNLVTLSGIKGSELKCGI